MNMMEVILFIVLRGCEKITWQTPYAELYN